MKSWVSRSIPKPDKNFINSIEKLLRGKKLVIGKNISPSITVVNICSFINVVMETIKRGELLFCVVLKKFQCRELKDSVRLECISKNIIIAMTC